MFIYKFVFSIRFFTYTDKKPTFFYPCTPLQIYVWSHVPLPIFLFLKSRITLKRFVIHHPAVRQCATLLSIFLAKTKTTFSFPASKRSCALRTRWFQILPNILVLFPQFIFFDTTDYQNLYSTEGGQTKWITHIVCIEAKQNEPDHP